MAKRLKNLLRGSIHPRGVGRWVPGCFAATLPLAALRGARFLAYPQGMSRSLRSVRLALKPLATVLHQLGRGWRIIRRLSGDDGYERYLTHHTTAHPGIRPLDRGAWFARQQQQKWAGVKRCC